MAQTAPTASDWGQIPGWLTPNQAQMLQQHARTVADDQWVVEIGSHQGRSTAVLAANAEQVLAIDPWANDKWGGNETTVEQFRANLERCGVTATEFQGTSIEAAAQFEGRVGMLFIDGAHDLPSVLADIDGWAPHLAAGAIVCLHDAFSSIGVTRAIVARYLGSSSYRYLGCSRSLIALRREPVSGIARAVSTIRLASRLVWFARNLAVKTAIKYVIAPWRWKRGLSIPQMPY